VADEQPPPAPKQRATPHDALFKLAFGQPRHAEGMLRAMLPAEVAERLDFTTLELVPGSFRDVDLHEVEADLLFRIASVGDEEVFIYALLEHLCGALHKCSYAERPIMRRRVTPSWSRSCFSAHRMPSGFE
jgi:hypothetical protein